MLGTLDGYEVLELIGRGGMGAVFRAVDPRLQRVVAIKTLLPDLADSEFDRRCFIQEGRAVAALNHQNIVSVYALGEQAGISYLVMEYIRGTSLANRLLQQAPLPLADVIQVGLQTAAGLSVAHEQGLVHRDIKPANLLVEEKTQRIKIVDFGLALAIGQGQPGHTEGLVGTPYFMSPEQARSQPTDPRTDLFSLGSVLYTASTGRLPFDGDKLDTILDAIRNVNPPPVRQLNPAIPAWLDEIITQLLAKDRARRFPSAADLKRLLVFHLAKLQAARGQSPAK
jgi:serine/threonine protein kinase